MFTAPKPFITPAVFRDGNLSGGRLVMVAVAALLAPWLRDIGNDPVETAGLEMVLGIVIRPTMGR